jgi:hypothetical protein
VKNGLAPLVVLFLAPVALPSPAGEVDEVAELRAMIEAMRADYERRIGHLEQRLAQAEQATGESPVLESVAVSSTAGSKPVAGPSTGTVTSGNAFNPQTSVILNGNYYHDDVNGEGTALLSEALQPSQPAHEHDDHAHGSTSNGFNFSELELAFSAAVDPYFDASAYIAMDSEGDVHVEEAWFRTLSLSQGLKVKGGKFFSDFGYINNQHPHQWDFSNQNLAYLNLLGDHGLQDIGLQLTWLPETPVYLLLGAELLQGDQELFGALVDNDEERGELGLDDPDDGPRLWTAFLKLAPDLGFDHALQLGLSWAHNRQHQEIQGHGHDHEEEHQQFGLEGDADLWGLDLVYKYDSRAGYGHRDLKLQMEYLWSVKDLDVTGGDPAEIGSQRELTTDGLYIQGLYGLAPRWQVGLRYDALGLTNRVSGGEREEFDRSDRWTAALTWLPSEFSLLRLQYEYSDIQIEPGISEDFNTVWLQFIMSMGTHGAHAF